MSETQAAPDLGRLDFFGDQVQATLPRAFEHAPQTLWAYLTDSAKLPLWLAPGEIDLRVGGRARLDFIDSGIVIDSIVSQCAPGRVLAYSWSGPGETLRPVTWTLAAAPFGTRLTLTLDMPASEDVARACAGWEAHLEMLAAALEGVPIKFPFERFKATREAYRARLP
jgi:uncharacterized protein YndB with AHSA1/START domain